MKFSFTKKSESEFFLLRIKFKQKNSGGREGRGVARVSDFFSKV